MKFACLSIRNPNSPIRHHLIRLDHLPEDQRENQRTNDQAIGNEDIGGVTPQVIEQKSDARISDDGGNQSRCDEIHNADPGQELESLFQFEQAARGKPCLRDAEAFDETRE